MAASCEDGVGFEFGFNVAKFSDRLLIIEILPDPPNPKSGNWICGEGCLPQSILLKNLWLFTLCSPAERVSEDENRDEGSSESPAGPTILRVKTVNISSIVLASRSPYFYKMFSNGMRESEQAKVTLQIYASEETALMDLIKYMYSGKLIASTPTALLDVLILADKYQVTACITMCGKLLQTFSLTSELALSYVDLPSSVLAVDGVLQLVAAATSFLAKVSKNITEYENEAMKLPLDRVKAALSSDELHVNSEDEVYDFFIKWVTTQFPNLNDRHEVLSSQLCRCIRFPHLSCAKLREVLNGCDLDPKVASLIVMEALFFKAERLDRQRGLMKAKLSTIHESSYVERAYKLHPIRVIEFDTPLLQCIVHLDLKRDDLRQMGQIRSQDFYAGGNQFHLELVRHGNDVRKWFGMYIIGMAKSNPDLDPIPITVQFEIAVRQKVNGIFKALNSQKFNFKDNTNCGFTNIFNEEWAVGKPGSYCDKYFIDDVMYLRADVIVENSAAGNPVRRQ